MRRALPVVFGLLWACGPVAVAWAAPVELRSDIVSANGVVTLGDLFDDAGAARGVLVARAQPGAMVVLEAARVQKLARANGLDWANDRGLMRIIAQPGGAAPVAQPAARRARSAETLTYVHNLQAGDLVQAQDLSWSRTADAPLDAPRDPDAVIGMAARRPIREGQAVSLRDVAAPMVIKKDDMISVAFNLDGVNVALEAKALENAVVGQPLSVMNLLSKKVIQAVASGPGQAVVGPEAERLRAMPALSLSRLAQR
jgi:flagella basal body P-ring formation protein FlgA